MLLQQPPGDQRGHWSWLTAERDTDGSILSLKVHTKDEDLHFTDLAVDEQTKVLDWIRANVLPRKTPLEGSTSCGMKHTLDRRTNIYVSNNQLKEAMLLCDFYPVKWMNRTGGIASAKTCRFSRCRLMVVPDC